MDFLLASLDVIEVVRVVTPELLVAKADRIVFFGHLPKIIHIELHM
jgi:hypothetical protein